MSKSLNNFFTVRDVAKVYGYEPIRYLMISSHYRSPINYSEDIIKQCSAALDRLYTCRRNLLFAISNATVESSAEDESILDEFNGYRDRFVEKMSDDLNTADAIGVLFDFVREINTRVVSQDGASRVLCEGILKLFDELTDVLGIVSKNDEEVLDSKVEKLICERAKARASKDWVTADKIRDELKK